MGTVHGLKAAVGLMVGAVEGTGATPVAPTSIRAVAVMRPLEAAVMLPLAVTVAVAITGNRSETRLRNPGLPTSGRPPLPFIASIWRCGVNDQPGDISWSSHYPLRAGCSQFGSPERKPPSQRIIDGAQIESGQTADRSANSFSPQRA